MDQHIPRAITQGLPARGVDVLTAYEDRADQLPDPDLLDRATELGRVLFTMDDDLLIEAAHRQESNTRFNGVIYAHQLRVTIGGCVHQLEVISQAGKPEDMTDQVMFLKG